MADDAPDTPPADATAVAPAGPYVLTRDDLLAAPTGRRFKNVPADEWKPGAVVRVSSLSSEMRDLLENYLVEQRKRGTQDNLRAFYVWLCAVDANGERLFKDPADVVALGKLSAAPVDRVFTVSLELNDVSDAAVEKAAGNSGSEGGGTSSSPSL